MLLNDLFIVKEFSAKRDGNKTLIEANLSINQLHIIFKGHFPGLPIVPGVCMVQVVKELMEQQLNNRLILKEASNIKFLSMINPEVNDEVHTRIQFSDLAEGADADGELYFGEITFFKIKGKLIKSPY